MIILISLSLLLGLGMYLLYKGIEEIGFVTSIISGVLLLVAIIALPISYFSELASIERYKVIKTTIEESRGKEISDIERAAITNTIIDVNKYIASSKYWNETIFDIYIPDELTELEYLK
ncbi:hypothetical protein [Brevibacillus sp. NRS-1366]|uniref:hypothetical protein n=1 Tax=Brevibacillus sp. NRS-1366 TaxID=3233899 RepID=UPI003D2188E9